MENRQNVTRLPILELVSDYFLKLKGQQSMPNPKKAPKQTNKQTPPKQTSKPAGGFNAPRGGGSPHPVDGSQDKGKK